MTHITISHPQILPSIISIIMFRDRTNLYLSYRRTVPAYEAYGDSSTGTTAANTTAMDQDPEAQALMHRKYHDAIPLQQMAPSIFSIQQQLDGYLAEIKTKTAELTAAYKKLLVTAAADKPPLESRIESLNYEITKQFEQCYVMIKKYAFLQGNYKRLQLGYSEGEVQMIDNMKKRYASQVQQASMVFRNLQSNYMKFLRDDSGSSGSGGGAGGGSGGGNSGGIGGINSDPTTAVDPDTIEDYLRLVLQQQQLHALSQDFEQRDREISNLAMGILEILTIFRELETLVVEQGTILDRIDYNIGRTAEDVKQGSKELVGAQRYQKRTTKCKVIFLLSLVVFALVIVLLMRPGGGGGGGNSEKPEVPEKAPEKPVPEKVPEKPVPEVVPERPDVD